MLWETTTATAAQQTAVQDPGQICHRRTGSSRKMEVRVAETEVYTPSSQGGEALLGRPWNLESAIYEARLLKEGYRCDLLQQHGSLLDLKTLSCCLDCQCPSLRAYCRRTLQKAFVVFPGSTRSPCPEFWLVSPA